MQLSGLTDQEIIQQVLNGLFEENKLDDPTTIVDCIDDDSAHKIVVFTGESLDKAAKGSLSDIIALNQTIRDFISNFDPTVQACLTGNPEIAAIKDVYHVTGVDQSVIDKKIWTYLTLHFLSFHRWAIDVDSDWQATRYYSVGQKAGQEGHLVLGMQRFHNIRDRLNIIKRAIESMYNRYLII